MNMGCSSGLFSFSLLSGAPLSYQLLARPVFLPKDVANLCVSVESYSF